MEEQQHSIDDIFRKSLGDYREAPPAAAWEQVARRLEEEGGRRRFAGWPWMFMSLLLLVGCAWIVVGLNTFRDKNAIVATSNTAESTLIQSSVTTNSTYQAPAKEASSSPKAHIPSEDLAPIAPIASVSKLPSSPAGIPTASQTSATNEVAVALSAAAFHVLADQQVVQKKQLVPVGIRSQEAPIGKLAPAEHLAINATTPIATALVSQAVHLRNDYLDPKTLNATGFKPVGMDNAQPAHQPNQVAYEQRPLLPRREQQLSPLTASQHVQVSATHDRSMPGQLLANNGAIRQTYITSPAERVKAQDLIPQPAKQSLDPTRTASTKSIENTTQSSDIGVAPVATVETEKPATKESELRPDQEAPKSSKRQVPVSLSAMLGYEHGFNDKVDRRYAAGVQLLWQLSRNVSVGVQPLFRFGNLPTVALTNDKAYQRSTMELDSSRTWQHSPSIKNAIDSIYNYVIRETFDSIVVKGTNAGGNFWELELPLLLHCKLNNAWYVFGGPSVNFGGKLNYYSTGQTQTYTSYRKDSLSQSQQLPRHAFNNYFGKSGLPVDSGHKPYTPQDPASVRLGYMAGVGYTWKRVQAQLSVHQQLSGYQSVPAPLQVVYASPYIRFSLGYTLFAPKAGNSNAK